MKRRRWFVAVVVCALAVIGIVKFSRPGLDVPPGDVSGVPPALARDVEAARQAVEDDPDSAMAWGRLGMLLFAHEMDGDAATCFQQATELDRTEFLWPYLHGLCLSVKSPDVAMDAYRQAAALRPNDATIQTRIAEMLFERGDLAAAAEHFRTADALGPSARTSLGLARVAYALGDFESSRKYAEQAVALADGQKSPHAFLAMVQQRLGDRDAALASLAAAEGLPEQPLLWDDPYAEAVLRMRDDVDSQITLGNQLMAAGRVREAIDVFAGACQASTADVRPCVSWGRALTEAHDYPAARTVLEDAVSRFPESAAARFQLGALESLERNLESATRQFTQTIALKHDHGLAHYNLGLIRERAGDAQGALTAFRNAARCRPTDASVRISLARAELAAGNHEAARQNAAVACELEPSNTEAAKLLEELSGSTR